MAAPTPSSALLSLSASSAGTPPLRGSSSAPTSYLEASSAPGRASWAASPGRALAYPRDGLQAGDSQAGAMASPCCCCNRGLRPVLPGLLAGIAPPTAPRSGAAISSSPVPVAAPWRISSRPLPPTDSIGFYFVQFRLPLPLDFVPLLANAVHVLGFEQASFGFN
ncbi:hypothetical protein U9M48_014133 [Paspalum notatum var. saurae]|uniref:Uncharacterized protein n=1 Tax=Paspalum notatum var. saurae TaxID=547442 RepID=A0AAQ3T1W9_PASNO